MKTDQHKKEVNESFAQLETKLLAIDLEPFHKKQIFELLKQLTDIQSKYINLLNDPHFKVNDDNNKSDFNINAQGNFINQTLNKNN